MLNKLISRRTTRSNMVQQDAVVYSILLWHVRKISPDYWQQLPASGDGSHFGIYGGATAGSYGYLRGSDAVGNIKTEKGAFLFCLPPEYVAGQSVTIRMHAKTVGVPAVTNSLDLECYETDREEDVSADLCTTDAQDCSSTSYADYDFVIDSAGLGPGDLLSCIITGVCDDTGGSGFPNIRIAALEILLDIKG